MVSWGGGEGFFLRLVYQFWSLVNTFLKSKERNQGANCRKRIIYVDWLEQVVNEVGVGLNFWAIGKCFSFMGKGWAVPALNNGSNMHTTTTVMIANILLSAYAEYWYCSQMFTHINVLILLDNPIMSLRWPPKFPISWYAPPCLVNPYILLEVGFMANSMGQKEGMVCHICD